MFPVEHKNFCLLEFAAYESASVGVQGGQYASALHPDAMDYPDKKPERETVIE